MSFITKIVLENGLVNGYYGCQLIWSEKATPELIKKYNLEEHKCLANIELHKKSECPSLKNMKEVTA